MIKLLLHILRLEKGKLSPHFDVSVSAKVTDNKNELSAEEWGLTDERELENQSKCELETPTTLTEHSRSQVLSKENSGL